MINNTKTYFLLLFFCGTVYSQGISSSAGSASGLLLRFDTSPRAASLSGAFTALADDENALMYNPGALTNFQQGMVSLNHTQWFADIKIDNIAFGYYLSPKFGIGASFTHLWMPAIKIPLDEFGQQTADATINSSVIRLGMGYRIIPEVRAGFSLNYLNDKLDDFSASAFSADIGLQFKFFKNRLLAGLVVQNLGGKLKFEEEAQDIPLTFRSGAAWRFINPDINISVDVMKSKDTDVMVLSGVEYTFLKQFSLRVGNRYSSYESLQPSFGVGFNLQQKYYINYSFINFSALGGTHRIGFSFRFASHAAKKRPAVLYDATKPVVLIPPADLKVEIKKNELHIDWGRVTGVQYNVYARHSSQKDWFKINKTPLYNNSMKFKKPKTEGRYYFKVCSVHNGKESAHSKEVSIDVK